MTLTRDQINLLKRRAASQPAAEAALSWTMVWGLVTCGLLWLFRAQAFPRLNDAPGMSLAWVGSLIVLGGFIAAALCYALYKRRMRAKLTATAHLKALIADHQHHDQADR